MTNATLGFQIDSSQASSAAADLDKLTAAAARTQQAADKLEAEAAGLNRAMGQTAAAAGRARPDIEGLGRSFGSQDEHVRSFRMEMERLTLKYQPLAQATRSYEATIAEINRAHQLGVINAQQMQRALDAERASFERLRTSAAAAGSAVKAANSNSGSQNFNAANAGYQFQDIAVTAAMGMNPLMIGLQQGTQLASVVSAMERPVAGLASAFMSLVSPVSLVTIGLTAGAAALIQYFQNWNDGSGDMSEDLKKQAEMITALADRWGDAVPALKQYADELNRAKEASELQAGVGLLNERTLTTIRSGLDDAKLSLTDLSSQLRTAGTESGTILQLENAFSSFAKAADEGKLSSEQVSLVQTALSAAIKENHIPALDEFAKVFDKIAKAALGASENIDKTGVSAALAASRMNDPSTWRSFGRDPLLGTGDGPIQGERYPLPEYGPTPSRRPLRELEGDGSEDGPAMITNSDGRLVNVPVPGRKPNFFELEQQKEKVDDLEKAYRKAQEAKADFWLDLGFSERQSERSAIDQKIASTLNRYGFDENLKSPEANALRQQYQREEQKAFFKGFFSDMYNEAWANGGNIGKAIAKSALNAAQEAMGKAWDNLFEKLASGISSLLFGGSGSSLTSSGGGGLVASAASALVANDNSAKVTSVTRSALSNIPTTDIAAYITKAALARGIDPSIALRVAQSEGGLKSWNMQSTYMKNGVQEPSFGPYQLYMGGGLGNAFQKKTGLDPRLAANGPAGVDFALDNAAKSGWGAWYGAKKAGIGNWDGIGVGGAKTAADAVNNLADSAGAATKGLDSFGGGLDKLGQSLSSSFFPAAPAAPGGGGGGGVFSWLGSLFGGGGAQWSAAKSGKITGLFANGTNYAPGGLAIVGEQGPELVDLPQGSKVFSNGKSNQMMSAAANGNESGRRDLNVNISGASGDAHVRMLVQQGVAEALAADKDQQRRGGFGAMQVRYNSQKG